MKPSVQKAMMRVYNGDKRLDNDALSRLFIKQVDNVYCIKKNLVTILPALAEQASFADLKTAILENADQLKVQILRMEVIYKLLSASYVDNDCIGLKTISLEAYMAARSDGHLAIEHDLLLLIHLQIIESVETAYFSVLRNIAARVDNPEIETLLDQNLESSINNKKLYELIAKEYID